MIRPVLILMILLSMSLIGFGATGISLAGKAVIYLSTISFIVISLVQHYGRMRVDRKALVFLLILLGYFIFRSTDIIGVASCFQLLLLIGCFVAFSYESPLSRRMLRVVALSSFAVFAALFFVSRRETLFANGNYVSVLVFMYGVFLYVSLSGKLTKRFLILIALAMIMLAGARSVLLGALLAFVYTRIIFFSKFKNSGKILILITATIVFALSLYFASNLINSAAFNEWLLSHTGKRLDSGRLQMWGTLFDGFGIHQYIFGVGGGGNLDALMGIDTHLSTHSLYVYVIASYGVVGLAIMLLVFWRVLVLHYYSRRYFSFFACFALMVRDFFEVSLIHNNFPIAVFFWGICASGFLESSVCDEFSSMTMKPPVQTDIRGLNVSARCGAVF